jgi:hypothetical protein
VPSAPLVDFIADSYALWLQGDGIIALQQQPAMGAYDGAPAGSRALRPELAILRGKIRRALTQLRQATYDASGRQGDEHTLLTLLQGADFSRSGRLDWPDFSRVLREDLRLQLVPLTDATGHAFTEEQRAMVARQLARSDAQQRAAAQAGLATSLSQALSQADEATLEVARDEELALLRAYRESAKADVVRRRLQEAVTTAVALYPRFGQVLVRLLCGSDRTRLPPGPLLFPACAGGVFRAHRVEPVLS